MYILLAYAGMRVSEVAHINASWWNGQEVKVPLKQECSCRDCAERGYWEPKTRHGARTIPIKSFYRPILTTFFKASPAGIGMTRFTIRRRLSQLTKRAGLSIRVFPHCFRATLASEFADSGLDQSFMKQFFGWRSFRSAEAYINLSTKRLNEELRKRGLI